MALFGEKDIDMLALNQLIQVKDDDDNDMRQWAQWRIIQDAPRHRRVQVAAEIDERGLDLSSLKKFSPVARHMMNKAAERLPFDDNDVDMLGDSDKNLGSVRSHWGLLMTHDARLVLVEKDQFDYDLIGKIQWELKSALLAYAQDADSIRRCEVCHYPFYARRAGQFLCSRRCGTRRGMRKTREKKDQKEILYSCVQK